ncbi:mitochondrial fission ELM1 family protein [Acetobacter pasteurianus]|uniref:Mitochondrial fission protein ELM1 n=3 Tax=Acetobacter pasteurianus TaxID=438 RepID=C7JD44_ACEP3|nr:mitochondrial fission ELM1 family protein [Acetobacter pasteurianus]ASC06367.1 Mitochondrial fission protein ELM1 [Acetobacter pasteurianus subsp. pasteurianus]BAI00056.1 hypothetical protein APA01_19310 [Acetobacter pasteurianus IFO 3283-01]BAI03109.1 hypothetical protein APA03_19310 [Acetobacter pasteurianus IFO 3283-03]BAI06154.1 hypothetical protein APA07_19310 [Acetobacter pasteurianus IFO 3283-07]BAI09204.1 hypothetical protein APA22_19310 [Acetobacter pasteurianus IFO 3283-22]BAI122
MARADYAGTSEGSNMSSCGTQAGVAAFVVGEDFAGMRSQALGLVARAGWNGTFHPICPSKLARIMLRGPRWIGKPFLRGSDGAELEENPAFAQSSVVVSVGGKGGEVGAGLRGSHRPVVQIQNPRKNLSRFDLIVACRHDDIAGPNVLLGRTALHGLTPEALEQARAQWKPQFAELPRPLIAALVGGSNGRFHFGEAEAHRLGQVLVETLKAEGGSLVVTPSRRTSPAAMKVLTDIVEKAGGHVWNGEGENPYEGLIACADNLIVTIDSVSMISEAVAGCAPVTIYPLPGRSRRISDFIEELELAGRVHVLEDAETRLPAPWLALPLDDTPYIIAELHKRLGF